VMSVPNHVIRVALEEAIAAGPEIRIPVETRVQTRLPDVSQDACQAALKEARRAIDLAEEFAREYLAGARTQDAVVDGLRRNFGWLEEPTRHADDSKSSSTRDTAPVDLAVRLSSYGFHCAIM
jgi:hypothetical protein